MLGGLQYSGISNDGVEVTFSSEGASEGEEVFPADHVILCAGQVPRRELYDSLLERKDSGVNHQKIHLIGGAHEAAELDAKRAIAQGTRVAAKL